MIRWFIRMYYRRFTPKFTGFDQCKFRRENRKQHLPTGNYSGNSHQRRIARRAALGLKAIRTLSKTALAS